MNRDLKKSGIISVAVHAALIIFLMSRSFISCHRINARNISPFIDLQIGASALPKRGGAGAASVQTPPKPDDDAFPAAPKSKGEAKVSKKLVKHPAPIAPIKQLSEDEIKSMLGKGVVSAASPLSATVSGSDPGGGGGGIPHPYAWFYNQVRAVMYAAWQQPSSLIGKKGLVTTVEIRVQRDGQIARKKIISSSGNTPMDESVLSALEAVSRLPELPAGFGGLYQDIRIDFELTDMARPTGE